MDKLKVIIVGFGNRGQLFGDYAIADDKTELVAVADVNENAREKAVADYGVKKENCFKSAEEIFACGKIADAAIICTQDKQHKEHAVKAMELGYDVCLEKPIAATFEDCEAILAAKKKYDKKVMICHVLRYSHFYYKLREIIKSGELGDVVTISQTENVAYWHDAHSYVRGAWRNKAESSPMILAKCCHDLDIIYWLIGKKCKKVSSFGDLYYFKKENAPKGSAARCQDCPESVKKDCPYDAYKIYNDVYKAYNPILGNSAVFKGTRKEHINALIEDRNNPYGRCVFACDNDVVDHQVVNMLFEDNVTAQLTMTAFSKECHRCIKIHGTLGEIEGDMEENKITVRPFRSEDRVIDLTKTCDDFSVHGGGDKLLFEDFVSYVTGGEPTETRTTIEDSMISHRMSFAAEESRIDGGKPIDVEC
mgnify:CR=1 FL=1